MKQTLQGQSIENSYPLVGCTKHRNCNDKPFLRKYLNQKKNQVTLKGIRDKNSAVLHSF